MMKKLVQFFSNVVCRIAAVYILHNSYHDRYYIGQSTDSGNRMFDHSSDLANNRHRNSALQDDYNELKRLKKDPLKEITCTIHYHQTVIASVPYSEEAEALKVSLLKMELDLICSYSKQGRTLYNHMRQSQHQNLSTTRSTKRSKNNINACNARPCIIFGEYFPSVLEASIRYTCTTNTVKRRIDNKANPNWNYANNQNVVDLTKKVRFNDPITGKTHDFSSMNEAHLGLKNIISKDIKAYHNLRIYASPTAINDRCNNRKNTFQWISDHDPKKPKSSKPKQVW